MEGCARGMIVYTPLHGVVFVPDRKEDIISELDFWREIYFKNPSSYSQSMIDSLECALDMYWRKEDV